MPAARLPRSFYATGAETLAVRLLGQRLVRVLPDGTRLAGVIVETEAYVGVRDRASHAFGGRRTPRNEPMYARPGTAYVYFTYGMHHCFNVVCGEVGEPAAVLVRALEPTEGDVEMFSLRGVRSPRELCSGPGKLCRALAIDRALSGVDLVTDARIFLERGSSGPVPRRSVVRTPRVGIASAGDWAHKPLRWFVGGNPHVSRGIPTSSSLRPKQPRRTMRTRSPETAKTKRS